jgi:endo-1,4-beta-xylanase
MSEARRGVATLACALALLGASAAPARAQTTIFSSDFEDGTTQGWGPRGPVLVTASTDVANGGVYSLKTTGRTAAWNGPSLNVFPLLSTGATYQITGYVRLMAPVQAPLKFTVQRTTAGATSYDQVVPLTDVTDSAWVKLQGTYSFPTDTTALSLYLESSDETAAYYLDDFSIIELGGSGCPWPPDQTGFSSDFEDGTAQGWSRRGSETVAVTTADAHGGGFSLLTSNRTAAWNGPSHDAQCRMHNGSRYYVSLWAKLAPGEPDVPLKVSIQRTFAGSTNYNTVLGSKTVTANEWVHFEGKYTFTYDTTALSIYVESSGPVGDPPHHPSFYIDDFRLVYSPQPPIQLLPPLKDELQPYFQMGAAIEPAQTGGLHSELLLRHFNSVTAENAMKFGSIHPTENAYNFGPADALASFARGHGLTMRGHTLLWHEQVPEWLFEHADGTPLEPGVDRDLLLERLRSHIQTVVTRYNDVVSSWDVVNEPIDASQPDGLRVTPWLQIIGPDYIDKAFEYAREYAGPDAKLYLNEFSTTDPTKRQALLRVVEGMLERGVPFDGVGHQMHVNVYLPAVAEIRTTLETFGNLGLDNQITEMDMSVYSDTSTRYDPIPPDLLVLQGHRYEDIFRELRKQHGILSSVTLWGLGDDTSWLNRSRKDAPLLFDEDLQAKWAYWGIVDPSELPVLIQTLEVSYGTPHVDAHTDAIWDVVTPVSIPSEGAASASFKALWDDAHVYVRVDVAGATLDPGDGIDVFIDENNDKTPAYGPDDAHYAFDRFGKTRGGGLRGLMVPTRRGYRLEAAIPLHQVAAVGRQIGFDLRVRDGDQRLSWNDTTNGQDADTSRFGVIALVNAIETAEAAHGTPLIDAAVDRVWARAEEIVTGHWVLGAGGATARVKTLWDEGHLYVLARVSDALLSKASPNPWEQDSVEIFVDQNNAKTDYYEADDGQYRVNYENAQSYGGAASAASFVTATRVVDGGYIVEAAIALGAVRARAGRLLGFDLQVNDDATGTGVRSSAATWSDETGRAYLDTSRFGVLRLRMGCAGGGHRR